MCLHEGIIPLGLSLIRELRCFGNNEVVEIYHCDELSLETQELIHSIDGNVRVIDICTKLVKSGVFTEEFAKTFQSYWLKPLAVHQTELQEIMLLDADDILLKDPAVLRDTPGYVNRGTIFFYDRVINQPEFFNKYRPVKTTGKPRNERYMKYWIRSFNYTRFDSFNHPSKHFKQSLAYRGRTCHEQDSSMLLIDKARGAKAMSVLWFLITEERFVYPFSWYDIGR